MNLNKTQKLLLRITCVLAVLVVIAFFFRACSQEEEDPQTTPGTDIEQGIAQEDRFSTLTYSNGTTTLSFHLNELDQWVWSGDPDFPLDPTTVESILALVTDPPIQQTLTPTEEMESYGFLKPTATLTAAGLEGSSVTLELGKATTDGQSYYLMRNGDESTLYTVPASFYETLSIPIYDMYDLPELPDLSAHQIDTLTITGAATTILTARHSGGDRDEDTSWRCDGANVSDLPEVKALLSGLQQVKLLSCVDYRPTDKAAEICGFSAPAATITVELGKDALEETFTLTIGAAAPAAMGENCRYVRINHDPSIFLTSGDPLFTLMNVAAQGLGG